tara:strand:+ start:2711 stop:3751 length:1041 start_codon:yes stop_codon:yes gene_type:complete
MKLSNEILMNRCLDLAFLGNGYVAPNPMVGCVIVLDDKIIGEGYHAKYGTDHAEVMAIKSVKDPSLLKDATLYVSLEPCNHFGKTPPCVDRIIKAEIKKVVIGCEDIHSKVSGRGVSALRDAGIEVIENVLQEQCEALNKRFFTFHKRKRPYVVLKWAQTKDGFLDRTRDASSKPKINWISAPETKSLVHKWRAEEDAILVGRNTVLYDNPSLTVREWTGQNPVRIVIDSHLQTDIKGNVFSDGAKTLILNLEKNSSVDNVEYIKIEETSTRCILNELYKRGIQSVLVEGGSRTLQYFIVDNAWDEARVIVGNQYFEDGIKAPVISKVPSDSVNFGEDKIYFYNRR